MPVYSWLTQVGTPRAWLAFNSSARDHFTRFSRSASEHLSAEDLSSSRNASRNQPVHYLPHFEVDGSDGILRELELEGHKHYELNQPYPHHHHHLICVRCNKTIEFKTIQF